MYNKAALAPSNFFSITLLSDGKLDMRHSDGSKRVAKIEKLQSIIVS